MESSGWEEEEILWEDPLVAVRVTNRDQSSLRNFLQPRVARNDPLVAVRKGTGTNGLDGWTCFH